jgi:ankyrin repeat protein
MARLLLSYGADGGAQNAFGEAPLHYAAGLGHVELVQALVTALGPSSASLSACSYRGNVTPLHVAAVRGHVDVVRRLIEFKANPAVRNRWGLKPVLLAARVPAPPAALALAQADAEVAPLLVEKKGKKGKGRKGRK